MNQASGQLLGAVSQKAASVNEGERLLARAGTINAQLQQQAQRLSSIRTYMFGAVPEGINKSQDITPPQSFTLNLDLMFDDMEKFIAILQENVNQLERFGN